MAGWTIGEWLFRGGIAVMAAAVIFGIIAAIVLHSSGKRLKKQLEQEYGKKRH